jgi:hypothetical protein
VLPQPFYACLSAALQHPKQRYNPQISAVFASGSIKIHAKSVDPHRAGVVLLTQPFEEIPKVWPHLDKYYAVELDILGGPGSRPYI